MISARAAERTAYLMLTEQFPSAHFYIGEAFVKTAACAIRPTAMTLTTARRGRYVGSVLLPLQAIPGYGIQKIYTDALDVTTPSKKTPR